MTRQYSSGRSGLSSTSTKTSNPKSPGDSVSSADVKQAVRKVADRAKDAASDAVTQVQDQATGALENQKELASDRLDSMPARSGRRRVRSPGGRGRRRQPHRPGFGSGGAGLRISANQHACDLVSDTEDLIRQHPAIVLGSAIVVGALVGHFLRASRRREDADENFTTDTGGLDQTGSESTESPSGGASGGARKKTSGKIASPAEAISRSTPARAR